MVLQCTNSASFTLEYQQTIYKKDLSVYAWKFFQNSGWTWSYEGKFTGVNNDIFTWVVEEIVNDRGWSLFGTMAEYDGTSSRIETQAFQGLVYGATSAYSIFRASNGTYAVSTTSFPDGTQYWQGTPLLAITNYDYIQALTDEEIVYGIRDATGDTSHGKTTYWNKDKITNYRTQIHSLSLTVRKIRQSSSQWQVRGFVNGTTNKGVVFVEYDNVNRLTAPDLKFLSSSSTILVGD
jgi:hypothetical protein